MGFEMDSIRNVIDFKTEGVSFAVPEGSICALVGPDGAGKTTIIMSILHVLDMGKGNISVLGRNMKNNSRKVRQELGVVFGEMRFQDKLTGRDINIMMRNIYKKWDSKAFYAYLERFSISPQRRCEELSGSMRRLLQLSVALSHNARILIMDEPLKGIDPMTRKEMLQLFRSYVADERHTILLTAQSTDELEAITNEVVFLNRGRIRQVTGKIAESEADDGRLTL